MSPLCTCGGHRTTCRSWLAPSTMWLPGTKRRSLGSVASAFTLASHLASPAPPPKDNAVVTGEKLGDGFSSHVLIQETAIGSAAVS